MQTGEYGWSLISQPATIGRPLVEQLDQGADQAGLALAALAEQHDVVAGEDRALDLRQHGVVEADDAGEAVLAGAHPREQVVAELALTVFSTWPDSRSASEGGRAVAGGGRIGAHCPTLRPACKPVAGGAGRRAVRPMPGRGRLAEWRVSETGWRSTPTWSWLPSAPPPQALDAIGGRQPDLMAVFVCGAEDAAGEALAARGRHGAVGDRDRLLGAGRHRRGSRRRGDQRRRCVVRRPARRARARVLPRGDAGGRRDGGGRDAGAAARRRGRRAARRPVVVPGRRLRRAEQRRAAGPADRRRDGGRRRAAAARRGC